MRLHQLHHYLWSGYFVDLLSQRIIFLMNHLEFTMFSRKSSQVDVCGDVTPLTGDQIEESRYKIQHVY